MKIAFLSLYSGVIDRGAETFVHEVAQRLANNHDVYVFQAGEEGRGQKFKVVKIPINFDWSQKSGAGTLPAKFFLDYRNRLVALFAIKSLHKIWKKKFEMLITVNGGWMPAFVRLVTWLYGGRLVISGQAGLGWDEMNNLWSFPDKFVALSTKAESWAKKVNPLVSVTQIPNGVDLKRFLPKGDQFKTNLKKPIFLCVGALTPSKRIDLAIRAVARLEKASLLVVGDGDLRDEIKSLGRRLLGERFRLEKVPFEKMSQVYRAADVFTLPSMSFYAFEIVLAEAMASNLPLVANDDPIRREIVGRAGLFVDPQDTEAYAEALEKALKIDWGDKPRRQAEKFSWDRIAKEYEKLFKELIGE